MYERLTTCFALSFVGGISIFVGCSYEPPQVSTTSSSTTSSSSSSGAGQGGIGGAGSTSSSGQGGNVSSSSSGQGGAAGICDEGSKPTCPAYTGPVGTENKGPCKASAPTCMQDNTWSDCGAEVLPTAETCASVGDLNCDGINPCTGLPSPSIPITGPQTAQNDIILAMATGRGKAGQDGPLYAVGARSATPIAQGNDFKVLVLRHLAGGQLQDWSDKFVFTGSGANGALATGVAILPKSGDVVITGIFYGGTLNIDNMMSLSASPKFSFIGRWTGTGTFVKGLFLSGGSIETKGIVADSLDNIYIAGTYTGGPTIDKTTLPQPSGPSDGFVACLSADLGLQWSRTITNTGVQSVDAIALINDSALAISTVFTGPTDITFGNSLVKTYYSGTEPDMIVSRLRTSDGSAEWITQVASNGVGAKIEAGGLAATPTTIAFGGRFVGTLGLNNIPYMNTDLTNNDSFIATLSANGGPYLNTYVTQGAGPQEIHAIAFDSVGDILLTGNYQDSYALPGVTLGMSQGVDAFAIKLEPNLNVRWAERFGDAAYQIGQAIAVGKGTGRVFVGGGFQGAIPEVQPPLMSTGAMDAFILELSD